MKPGKRASLILYGLVFAAAAPCAWGQAIPSPDGDFEVEPGFIMEMVPAENSLTRTVVISETTGVGPLDWEIVEGTGGCPVANPSGDVPWLSTDPITGTLPAGGGITVTIDLDSTGLVPGLYQAVLCVRNTVTPTDAVGVPVGLQVGSLPVPALSSVALWAFALLLVGVGILLIRRHL